MGVVKMKFGHTQNSTPGKPFSLMYCTMHDDYPQDILNLHRLRDRVIGVIAHHYQEYHYTT